ncbi:MAG TPA: NAD(P)-binding domain-containing protein [Terracidiphilus sp.]|jgi:thioredoxin reductase
MEERNTRDVIDVAIIGAGPYGLSIAAHLNARGVRFRIFGKVMSFWSQQMPEGMRLKSEGFASSLYDPKGDLTLGEYCRRTGLPYQHENLPVPLDTFVAYGKGFQRRFVPMLEEKLVQSVERRGDAFDLTLDTGEVVRTRSVVCAMGIAHYAKVPAELASLDDRYVSHSSAHRQLDRFRGKRVAVVGAGASAADLAALLREKGAEVQILAREEKVRFHGSPQGEKSLTNKVLRPSTGLGPGWKLAFYSKAPFVFRYLPEAFRLRAVRVTLGPAGGWFTRQDVLGKVPIHGNARITSAALEDGEVALRWSGEDGRERVEWFDHVIAATGFDVDVARLQFLSAEIRAGVRTTGKAPALSAHFESSVPGLYFVGVSAANTFGPLMRFAYGARFTARRISRRLAAVARRSPAIARVAAGIRRGVAAESTGR